MKLRIRENTIRLRLKQGEVATLASGEPVVEQTQFPGSVLTYSLRASDLEAPTASFENGELAVYLPRSIVDTWASSDQVSIAGEQPLADSGALSLLVEKDFQCLSPGDDRLPEDDADTYRHPNADSGDGC